MTTQREHRCPTCGSVLAIKDAPETPSAPVEEAAVVEAACEPLQEWLAKVRRQRWGVRADG